MMREGRIRYLVRDLTIINEKGEARHLSLFYIDGICENNEIKSVEMFKFDGERAGFEYVESMTLQSAGEERFVEIS